MVEHFKYIVKKNNYFVGAVIYAEIPTEQLTVSFIAMVCTK